MSRATQERLEGSLYANLFGSLTAEEKEELYAASLNDQSIFDQLMDTEDLRFAMETGEHRERLLRAIDQVAPRSDAAVKSGRLWFSWWTLSWSLGGVCAAVLAVLLVRGYETSRMDAGPMQPIAVSPVPAPVAGGAARKTFSNKAVVPQDRIEPAGTTTADPLSEVLAWEPQPGLGAEAQLVNANGTEPVVADGAPLLVHVSCPVAARVWLVEQLGNRAPSLVTPKEGVPVAANAPQLVTVPAAKSLARGEELVRGTLRLVALDAGDRLFAGDDLDEGGRVAPRTVMDLHFSVASTRPPE